MGLHLASVVAFVLMVAGAAWLLARREIFAHDWIAGAIQVLAVLLMIWARITFGRRSFHAAANPTEGGLVTTGPYRYLRHPIYAAILYFFWAAMLDRRTLVAIAGVVLVTIGAGIRIYAEERLLVRRYPEYSAYARRTPRVLPFVF
jgi:protein-S-isoprenylcysteine O-methyltransferase Ste14